MKKVTEVSKTSLHNIYFTFSSLYNVLIKDGENEKFDERRVNLLKSQLIQLERQASTRLLVFMLNAAFCMGRLTVLFIN